MKRYLDYDVHGRVGLRLASPTSAIQRECARQFDPLRPAPLTREPDVVLEATRATLTAERPFVLGDAGDGLHSAFDGGLLWLSSGAGRVAVPFDRIGEEPPWHMKYQGAVSARGVLIDYVRPLLHLSLLASGSAAVHASAVAVGGRGVLFAGWSESGKTEAALACVRRGARFMSDKWSILTGEGTIYHFPTPMTIRGWMLGYLPDLRANLASAHVYRARAATALESVSRRVRGLPAGGSVAAAVEPLLSLGTRISVTPGRLFRGREGVQFSAPLSALFLLLTRPGAVSVRPASLAEVVPRLVDCALYEWRKVLNAYRRFCYAYPERRNNFVEELRDVQAQALADALGSSPLFIVEAPFPFDLDALYGAVSPHLPK